jgi:hypothetical protein
MLSIIQNRYLLIGIIICALGITMLSTYYQKIGPETGVVGNLCGEKYDEPCYARLVNAGFPFGFIFDNPSVSVVGKIYWPGEDDLRTWPFIEDIIFYSFINILLLIIANGIKQIISKNQGKKDGIKLNNGS